MVVTRWLSLVGSVLCKTLPALRLTKACSNQILLIYRNLRGGYSSVRRAGVVVLVVIVLLLGIPAYAYGDPSGGTLFQVLMPMLAAVWATWMILANRIRRGVGDVLRRIRGSEPDEPGT